MLGLALQEDVIRRAKELEMNEIWSNTTDA